MQPIPGTKLSDFSNFSDHCYFKGPWQPLESLFPIWTKLFAFLKIEINSFNGEKFDVVEKTLTNFIIKLFYMSAVCVQ